MWYYFSRLSMGLVLWVCIIIMIASGAVFVSAGIVEAFTPDPWYVQWYEVSIDWFKGLIG